MARSKGMGGAGMQQVLSEQAPVSTSLIPNMLTSAGMCWGFTAVYYTYWPSKSFNSTLLAYQREKKTKGKGITSYPLK